MKIEICIASLAEAEMAAQSGADRVELCSALEIGGVTPTRAMIAKCCSLGLEVHVLIRPRQGDFSYSRDELALMKTEITTVAECKGAGVVFGTLDDQSRLDITSNKELVHQAELLGLDKTFHRAFDITPEPIKAVDQLIAMGFDRLLTSGQQPTAAKGAKLLRTLAEQAGSSIEIMAGGGVSSSSVELLQKAGVDALHFSARKLVSQTALNMGGTYHPDPHKIESIISCINHEA